MKEKEFAGSSSISKGFWTKSSVNTVTGCVFSYSSNNQGCILLEHLFIFEGLRPSLKFYKWLTKLLLDERLWVYCICLFCYWHVI